MISFHRPRDVRVSRFRCCCCDPLSCDGCSVMNVAHRPEKNRQSRCSSLPVAHIDKPPFYSLSRTLSVGLNNIYVNTVRVEERCVSLACCVSNETSIDRSMERYVKKTHEPKKKRCFGSNGNLGHYIHNV